MRGLYIHEAYGLGGSLYDAFRGRLDGFQDFAFIGYHMARIPCFHAVNGKRNIFIACIAFNIYGIARIVGKPEILPCGFGNGRVHGGLYISYNHGVVVPFLHLKLRLQNRIIKGRGYLADTASDTVHHLAIQVGTGHIVSVIRSKGADGLIGGEGFSGVNGRSVNQAAAIGHVGTPVLS